METYSLVCHADTPPLRVQSVDVSWREEHDTLTLCWRVAGAEALIVPKPADTPMRKDGLWQTSCCEFFLSDAHGYREVNLSPSGDWAAYGFSGYRSGMAQVPFAAPAIRLEHGEPFSLSATMPANILWGAHHASLTAVIEEEGGHKSYWALAHGEGQPDFHAPSCFILPLGAPPRA
ncbi:MAG: DOMON-like domain-containing protein [Sphingomonadales bacterium]|nr:DOMON-like domain-containing protein [Sphingomonadales bacterium]MDE2170213.1 DOMON-like domain-containing protein [Sphingomonadales bacterium]